MKTGWQTSTLGEICQLESGKPLASADRKSDGRYPVYGADGEIDRTDKYYFGKPTVIVGRKGTVGELNLTEERFWPLEDTYFVIFDEQQCDLQFLYHLLTSLDLHHYAEGAQPHIDLDEIHAQPVKVPPLPEQQRIAAILDAAFHAIELAHANTTQNLQNARDLRDSYLRGAKTTASGDLAELAASPAEQQRVVPAMDFLSAQTQRLESLYRRKLAALDELKKSLLQQAFAGEL